MFHNKVKDFLPKCWFKTDASNHNLVKLERNNLYVTLSSKLINSDIRGISEIYRIENPFLYSQYLLKKAEYESRGCFSEIELYHCTSIKNMRLIAENNFDRRFVRRSKFGLGVSFSPSPQYADRYASYSIGSDRAMIVADVLVGRQNQGNYRIIVPPEPYDTTTGNQKNVYVKFCDNEFYPNYAICYKDT